MDAYNHLFRLENFIVYLFSQVYTRAMFILLAMFIVNVMKGMTGRNKKAPPFPAGLFLVLVSGILTSALLQCTKIGTLYSCGCQSLLCFSNCTVKSLSQLSVTAANSTLINTAV